MDLIFIDGGKSFTEVKNDWEYSKTLIHNKTAVFVHNYEFSGVRRMVDNIPSKEFEVTIIHPAITSASVCIPVVKQLTEIRNAQNHQKNFNEEKDFA
jgi:predicted O-methyltransferase YrrM